jgi:hypothetical protein
MNESRLDEDLKTLSKRLRPNLMESRTVASRIVEMAAPTSVTKITGFLASVRGFSFLNGFPIAGKIIAAPKTERVLIGTESQKTNIINI